MKVKINTDKCISCGACEGNVPDVFELHDTAIVINPNVPANLEEDVMAAADICPGDAIIVEK